MSVAVQQWKKITAKERLLSTVCAYSAGAKFTHINR